MMPPMSPVSCPTCGAACRFASTSLQALAELADLGDALAWQHLVTRSPRGVIAADSFLASVGRPREYAIVVEDLRDNRPPEMISLVGAWP